MQMPHFLLSIAALTLIPLAATASPDGGADRPLGDYRDKNRVLLVFAPNAKDPSYVEQRKLWQEDDAGFDERQLVVVTVLADAGKSAGETPVALEKRYRIDPGAFAIVLIGKDGHDAYRAPKPVRTDALYKVIDIMPMRRAEARHPQPAARAAQSPVPMPQAQPDADHNE